MTEIQNNKPKTGMTDRMRGAGKMLNNPKGFTRREMFGAVNTRTRAEDMAFKEAWLEMQRRGEILRAGTEKYRYDPSKAPKPQVRIKIYRAMHVKGAFCAPDIAKLADAEISYVHGVIRRLVKGGELEFTGKLGNFKYFRVRNSDKFYQKFIKG